jgi:hypothetical protein
VKAKKEEIRRYILLVLYDDFSRNRYLSGSTIAHVLELNLSEVICGLDFLVKSGLVDNKESRFRLSEKDFTSVHQRASSYCPNI